jgi:F420-dependent oxidoreductase-like protein
MDEGLTRRAFLRGVGVVAATTALGGRLAGRAAAAPPAPGVPRFGVQILPQHATYADIEAAWLDADALGFDSAFTFDHFMPIFSDPEGPCFEGWMLLSALAAKTERIRVGVLVTGNTYRNPALLAKMASTVDHVSGGRLILGMGAGWFEREHQAYDVPFFTPGERARRLVEAVTIVKRLFTEDAVTFDGTYYTLKEAPFAPKPVQRPHPPILIGGMGPKVIQPLAARDADIWHFFVRSGEADEARRIVAHFDALCRTVGRDPGAVEKSTSLSDRVVAEEGVAKTIARVRALVDAGVQHLILSLSPPYDRDLLRRFAREVVPAFRSA